MPQNTPMGPADQAGVELRNDVLVYTSAPLDQPLFVAGQVTAVLHAATTARDTDWVVKLCDVSPDGRSINLQEGVVRSRYRDGATLDRPIEPNRVYEYRLTVGVVCHQFKPGHRLRVQVTSSNFPAWDRNSNTGDSLDNETPFNWVVANQTIFHDGPRASRLDLPVVRS
jgi:putative CocE/NonD family hydrolase